MLISLVGWVGSEGEGKGDLKRLEGRGRGEGEAIVCVCGSAYRMQCGIKRVYKLARPLLIIFFSSTVCSFAHIMYTFCNILSLNIPVGKLRYPH